MLIELARLICKYTHRRFTAEPGRRLFVLVRPVYRDHRGAARAVHTQPARRTAYRTHDDRTIFRCISALDRVHLKLTLGEPSAAAGNYGPAMSDGLMEKAEGGVK
ncbi:hypothetical protein K0M31_019813 [Melipona bicolor]|uniref:Uncharacterized protein n=1 Tax=Melipona bicolor TaxID=60889 RepID=A0AA40G3S6_9HYME|nr:hypothetical protein K0M31_019813 [Melipona bicolor]